MSWQLSPFSEEILHAVKIEPERETHRLIKRVALRGSNAIGSPYSSIDG